MKLKTFLVFSVLGLILEGCISQKTIHEDIEWSNFRWNHESDNSKPRILFIGNSISLGYVPEITTMLEGKANCDHLSTSRSIADPALYKETKSAMGKYNHVVIHFNNGLHGWHLTNEQYKKGLERYVKYLISHKSKDCILIYSLTTPVSSKEAGQKLDPVKNQVVLDRNRIASGIMKKYNIPLIDLYRLMELELDRYVIKKGNLHYNKAGYKVMAEKITEEIIKLMEKQKIL